MVVFIDDEHQMRYLFKVFSNGYFDCPVHCFGNIKEAEVFIKSNPVKCVICDHFLKGTTGIKFLIELISTDILLYLISGSLDIQIPDEHSSRIHLMSKPFDLDDFCTQLAMKLKK